MERKTLISFAKSSGLEGCTNLLEPRRNFINPVLITDGSEIIFTDFAEADEPRRVIDLDLINGKTGSEIGELCQIDSSYYWRWWLGKGIIKISLDGRTNSNQLKWQPRSSADKKILLHSSEYFHHPLLSWLWYHVWLLNFWWLQKVSFSANQPTRRTGLCK